MPNGAQAATTASGMVASRRARIRQFLDVDPECSISRNLIDGTLRRAQSRQPNRIRMALSFASPHVIESGKNQADSSKSSHIDARPSPESSPADASVDALESPFLSFGGTSLNNFLKPALVVDFLRTVNQSKCPILGHLADRVMSWWREFKFTWRNL